MPFLISKTYSTLSLSPERRKFDSSNKRCVQKHFSSRVLLIFVIYNQNYSYWQDFLTLSKADSKIQRLSSSKNILLPCNFWHRRAAYHSFPLQSNVNLTEITRKTSQPTSWRHRMLFNIYIPWRDLSTQDVLKRRERDTNSSHKEDIPHWGQKPQDLIAWSG